MKIVVYLMVALVLGLAQFVSAVEESTEEVRYLSYVVSCLEQLQTDGGVLRGRLDQDWSIEASVSFADRFTRGVARATANCVPGWYYSWASWEDKDGQSLFSSSNQDCTYLGAGVQTLPFLMRVNPFRSVRFQIVGVLPTDLDRVWFNGNQAWRDGNTWETWVNQPWNLIDTDIEVNWVGHGGWNIRLDQGSFGGVINLDASVMLVELSSPTRVKVISFLEDSYLEDGLISYLGKVYSPELECEVMNFSSGFDKSVKEFTLILTGYDEYSGERKNYHTITLSGVFGKFQIPLKEVWIMPQTWGKIYLLNPDTGEYAWTDIGLNDLWYDISSDGGGGMGKGK